MTLRSEMVDFFDKNNNVHYSPVKGQGDSDNGIMFTSEYYIQLARNGENRYIDDKVLEEHINKHMQEPGLIARKPEDEGQEGPDDLIAVLAVCKEYRLTAVAQQILEYGYKNLGWYNNENPGTIRKDDGSVNWQAFQWRQLQLLYANIVAAKQLKWYHFPLSIYTAIVILIAGWRTPVADTDPRRLSWLLVQIVKNESRLLRWVSNIWYQRLYKDYGKNPMQNVYKIYFNRGSHPFHRWYKE